MAHRSRWFCRIPVALAVSVMACSAAAQTASTSRVPSAVEGSGQAWPARPIRMVVAQSAGGNADFVSRAYAQRLAERLGQQIVVDNRPGGAGVIGTEIVARAVPDGYTLLVAPTGHAINPSLYSKLPFHPLRDFAPVSLLATSSSVIVVPPQLPVRNVTELIALAKARPGKLHFASSGMAAAT